jgi:hypothetical protein
MMEIEMITLAQVIVQEGGFDLTFHKLPRLFVRLKIRSALPAL